MVRFLQILFFIMASIVEVEVKASEANASQSPQFFPVNCIATDGKCTVRTSHHMKYQVKESDLIISIGQGSGLLRDETKLWNVVDGQVLVETKKIKEIGSLYATLKINGSAIVGMRNEKLEIRSLQGEVQFLALGHSVWVKVTEGYEVVLSKVTDKGIVGVSIPKAIDLKRVLYFLAQVSDESLVQFEEKWRPLSTVWRSAVAGASHMHKELYDRNLASQLAEAHAEMQRRQSVQREKEFYRQLMWKDKFEE